MIVGSPLRYPGGKAKLYPFFVDLIRRNGLFGRSYAEPYAGGAGLALRLLTTGFVESISLNDVDPAIFSFWTAALRETKAFTRMIELAPIAIDEWYRQREIWTAGDTSDPLALGFSAYYLNRTSRSGIIEGAGPIGGYAQLGRWKLDARLSKDNQIANLRALSAYSPQIELSCLDALEFVKPKLTDKNGLLYLDPPYYVKGAKLYKNFYLHEDHVRIASVLKRSRKAVWVLSYDDTPAVRELYSSFVPISYSLQYSAGRRATGQEVIYVSDKLTYPVVDGFARVA